MRLSKHDYFLELAAVTAKRSTCARRAVGCILVDEKDYIIGTGYNGVPHGAQHCTDTPCIGANNPTGVALDSCYSIHAEQNAIAHCNNVSAIYKAYLTVSPCMSCIKLLIATNCQYIIAYEMYDERAVNYWRTNGRWISIIKI